MLLILFSMFLPHTDPLAAIIPPIKELISPAQSNYNLSITITHMLCQAQLYIHKEQKLILWSDTWSVNTLFRAGL